MLNHSTEMVPAVYSFADINFCAERGTKHLDFIDYWDFHRIENSAAGTWGGNVMWIPQWEQSAKEKCSSMRGDEFMNSRERMLAAIEFRTPDRIPVFYHASSAGLYVHGQKLLDLFRAMPSDNLIEFTGIPAPALECFDENGNYHEFRRDQWGTTWEYLIFGIQGHPKEYALTDWKSAETYVLPPLPRFQPVPELRRQQYLLFGGGIAF